MSRKEFVNCVFARNHTDYTGKERSYNCGALRQHYCLTEKKPCPFYKSKYLYKMAWLPGKTSDNVLAPVPRFGYTGETYAGRQATIKKTTH